MKRSRLWVWVLRVLLAAVWLGNGLEKFGVHWPGWLMGGTGDVPGMLKMMAEETPVAPVAWMINRLMLPLGEWLTIPVGVLEVSVGLALAIGWQLQWAGTIGALIQTFFWVGFFRTDWPFQYPVLILAHFVLAVEARPKNNLPDDRNRWLQMLAVGLLVLMWGYEGRTGDWMRLATAALLLIGMGAGMGAWRIRWGRALRVVGLVAGLGLTTFAWRTEQWGDFVWAYYAIIAMHLSMLLAALL